MKGELPHPTLDAGESKSPVSRRGEYSLRSDKTTLLTLSFLRYSQTFYLKLSTMRYKSHNISKRPLSFSSSMRVVQELRARSRKGLAKIYLQQIATTMDLV